MTNDTCLPPAEVLIDHLPMDGAFNMALDEALLELAAEREHSIVRIYRWSEPTVSLGCFQARTGPVPPQFRSLPTVRRLSGGGAILHDQERPIQSFCRLSMRPATTLPACTPQCTEH